MSDSEQNKTEQATSYKLEQARKKGMVARSPDLGMVVALVFLASYISLRGSQLATELSTLCARAFAEAGMIHSSGNALLVWSGRLLVEGATAVAPLIATVLTGALLASLAQTGVIFAPAALKSDLSRLNPIQGVKRLFSLQLLLDAGKAFVKMAAYVAIAVLFICRSAQDLSHTALASRDIAGMIRSSGMDLLVLFLIAASIFAAIDQVIVRQMFARKMRMSRHEQKQEAKQREGDPRIKQRRRQLQRELLQRAKSMRSLRGADVLVTNPTHYAVGLKYDPTIMAAPAVVAKGAGDFALRLRKLAFIYGVPIIESRAVARQLYHKTALEQEVPGTLYRRTAEIYLKIRQFNSGKAA
ncbi:MAG: EscU/YscU/HrcU family type III secretion system export apparatus switch protein [Pseudomonas sp.]|uniref:EscU/YscU/HrcU family type III secretion system export apparatus switch protein n=1 Tax=Stenotrophomonas sp. TaxID=69392 RepID=UPI003D6CF589